MSSSVIITPTLSEVPSLQNSFTTAFLLPITVWRRGNVCLITGTFTRTSNPAANTVICNVSANFRPLSRRLYFNIIGGNSTINRVDLDPNGDLIYLNGDVTGYFALSETYLIV
jgi:hypothetical protein